MEIKSILIIGLFSIFIIVTGIILYTQSKTNVSPDSSLILDWACKKTVDKAVNAAKYPLQQQINTLQGNLNNLQSNYGVCTRDINSLRTEYDKSIAETNRIINLYGGLEKENISLNARNVTLTSDLKSCTALQTSCESDKTALQSSYNTCESDKTALQTSCESDKTALQSSYNTCESDKTALQTSCAADKISLQTRCESDKTALQTSCAADKISLQTRCESDKTALQNNYDRCASDYNRLTCGVREFDCRVRPTDSTMYNNMKCGGTLTKAGSNGLEGSGPCVVPKSAVLNSTSYCR